jgi:Kef-type K+ transport system membrane component KefB/mannitol/fructose-specific phosphotransferase system IIA component (Ntr-type)
MPLTHHEIALMFLSLGLLLALARLLAELAQWLGQPTVVGEILAGVLLGPTVLGRLWPAALQFLFPATGHLPVVLSGLTTLAIALFLLVAGMEVELSAIWRQGRTAVSVALAGIVVPFGLGLGTAGLAPYALGCEPDVNPWIFALFFATAVSISALPVIAKTLMDLGLYRSDLGMVVVSAAVCNDLVGWFIFAVILGMIGAGSAPSQVGLTIVLTLCLAAAMLTAGRWLVNRLLPYLQAYATWPGGVLGFAFSFALLAAAVTEWIGIHAVFGSFLVGICIGDSRHLREPTRKTIRDFVSFIFAPLFFAAIGLRVDFAGQFYPAIVAAVLVIACLGKVLGCGLAARWAGTEPRTAWAIGFAMNARGAMEIILGTLALNAGLISPRMFVALVVMALVTSMMSGPAIQRLLGRRQAPQWSDYLSPRNFRAPLVAHDCDAAIRELGDLLLATGRVSAPDLAALQDRHVRGQVAVLHAPASSLTQVLLAVGIAGQGIEFDASDGAPVRIVCLAVLPQGSAEQALAVVDDLAKSLGGAAALEAALAARNYTEFLAAVRTNPITT